MIMRFERVSDSVRIERQGHGAAVSQTMAARLHVTTRVGVTRTYVAGRSI